MSDRFQCVRRNHRTPARAAAGLALFLAITATAQEKPKPEVRRVRPMAITRGGPALATILVGQLTPTEIRFDDARIATRITGAAKPEAVKEGEKATGNAELVVEVTAPGDLPPGSYRFRLRQEGGGEAEGRLYIDAPCDEIAEVEPNDRLAAPQKLTRVPIAVRGTLDKEGVDVYQLDGRAGETWRIEILARRAGSPLEPAVRLRDPRRAPVRAVVDRGEDCAIEETLAVDGPYLIEIFDAENRTGADFDYRLRLTPVPTPVSNRPLGGNP